jgi:two-component system, cell cycle sensor histidine kinase and response regulator CckA
MPETTFREPSVLSPERDDPVGAILLVEDDAAVRAVARRARARHGFSVIEAADGPEAVGLAERHKDEICLLLTDIMMPGMNGVELAARVTSILPDIPVFFMSGYADQDLVRHGLLKPGTHFVQKPFTPRELADRVREILGARGED